MGPGGEVSGLLTPGLWSQVTLCRPGLVVLETRAQAWPRSFCSSLKLPQRLDGGGEATRWLEPSGHTPRVHA